MFKTSRKPSGSPRADLGPAYHRLWTATAISTLGDGVFLTALPLLAATLSRDPLRVSLITFAGWNAPTVSSTAPRPSASDSPVHPLDQRHLNEELPKV